MYLFVFCCNEKTKKKQFFNANRFHRLCSILLIPFWLITHFKFYFVNVVDSFIFIFFYSSQVIIIIIFISFHILLIPSSSAIPQKEKFAIIFCGCVNVVRVASVLLLNVIAVEEGKYLVLPGFSRIFFLTWFL